MTTPYPVNITRGRVVQHAPASTQGFEAALVDIAQDLLLRHLHDIGLLGELAFKGGTALRKLYAGAAGRFSLDLDFSVASIGTHTATLMALLDAEVSGLALGPFRFGLAERRGKKILTIDTDLGRTGQLTSKLDVNPPPWLEPVKRGWVPLPVHDSYGGPLPSLTVVRVEENVAEKIVRLNRTTTARDVYDLVWLWRNYRDNGGLDRVLVRRLAVLKNWVDTFGLSADGGTQWKKAHSSRPFVPERWLRKRTAAEFDAEDIGQLTVPTPDLDTLASELSAGYSFLTDLTPEEQTVAELHGDSTHRRLVLGMLADLPGGRLPEGTCW
jgi:predicted nucleotidyltransferase component of viral defense system